MTEVDQLRAQVADLKVQIKRTRWMLGVTLLVLGIVAGLVRQVGNDAADGRDAAEDVQSYVDELRTTTPEEEQRDAQIGAVITVVPQIAEDADVTRLVVCEAFPEATACLAPPTP